MGNAYLPLEYGHKSSNPKERKTGKKIDIPRKLLREKSNPNAIIVNHK